MNLLPIQALMDRGQACAVLREFSEVLKINEYSHWASQYAVFAKDLAQASTTVEFLKVWRQVSSHFGGGSGSIADAQARAKTEAERRNRAKRFNPAMENMRRYF